MNNGQMNIVSVQTVMQSVTQDSSVPVAVTMDGAEQNAGIFAGVLNGIQHVAKGKDMPDSGQTGQVPAKMVKHQRHLDGGTEGTAVALEQFQASPDTSPVSEPATSQTTELSKTDISTDAAVPSRSELSDIVSQMAMAVYLQTGRMPEVNISTPLSVDRLQNVATVTGQSAVVSAPTGRIQPEQSVTEPLLSSQVNTSVQLETAKESVPISVKMSGSNVPTPLSDGRLQSLEPVSVQSAAISAQTDKKQSKQTVAESLLAPQVTKPVPLEFAKESAPASSPRPVSTLQNVANAADQEALFSASPDKIQVSQTVTVPVQLPVPLTATTGSAPASGDNTVTLVTRTAELSALPAEKSAAPSIALQSALPSVHPDVPASIVSPETDVEIQLSQPQPITAQVTAEVAVAGNRSTGSVQETRTGKQRFANEQHVENVRADNEPGSVKEMVSSLHSATSGSESSLGSDTPRGGTSNQEHPDTATDNQMLAQQMRGKLSMELQKVAALSAKVVATEPAQDIPGQVMLQVKDRLEQYDVKPGIQQITLTLSPGSLGEIKMNLNLQGQKLSIEIVTENRMVRDAIMQHTDTLKESLARQNITMESFDVTSGGKGSGNQGQGQNQNAWRELAKQQQQQQAWTSPRGYQTAQADLPSGQATYQRQQGHSMLDIHY